MFEKFTDRARRLVVLANESARSLNHTNIGAEHVLHALLLEGEGVGAQVLKKAGYSEESLSKKMHKLEVLSTDMNGKHIPFTEDAKICLELALQKAKQLQLNYVGTEHVLLGIIEHALARAQVNFGWTQRPVDRLLSGEESDVGYLKRLVSLKKEVMDVIDAEKNFRSLPGIVGIKFGDSRLYVEEPVYDLLVGLCKSSTGPITLEQFLQKTKVMQVL
jgi:ATP-dependent Clp protease ATP-binding subunit ClpA